MGTHYHGKPKEVRVLNTWIKLARSKDSVASIAENSLKEFGITGPQFATLEILYHLGPQVQKVIADKLLCSTGNVTKVVDNIVKHNLAIREIDPNDRRYFIVRITTKGRKLIKKAFPRYLSTMIDVFNILTKDELKQLDRICKKLGTGAEGK